MHNLLRYIRQNRIKIIIIILFIIFAYSLIHVANDSYNEQGKKELQNTVQEERLQTDETFSLSNKKCEDTIKEFLKYCTKGEYETAYSYISQECKESKYKTFETFKQEYCEKNAIKGKTYAIEKDGNYKYKIEFNNMLSSGKTATKKTIHYYTIYVENGHEIKISIN